MARRKTVEQKEIEKTLKDELNSLGSHIISDASKKSKVDSGELKDSVNFRVKPFDTLIASQTFYGKYNTPKGKPTPSDRSNIKDTPLLNAIRDNVPESVEVIVKEMTDLLISPVVKK